MSRNLGWETWIAINEEHKQRAVRRAAKLFDIDRVTNAPSASRKTNKVSQWGPKRGAKGRFLPLQRGSKQPGLFDKPPIEMTGSPRDIVKRDAVRPVSRQAFTGASSGYNVELEGGRRRGPKVKGRKGPIYASGRVPKGLPPGRPPYPAVGPGGFHGSVLPKDYFAKAGAKASSGLWGAAKVGGKVALGGLGIAGAVWTAYELAQLAASTGGFDWMPGVGASEDDQQRIRDGFAEYFTETDPIVELGHQQMVGDIIRDTKGAESVARHLANQNFGVRRIEQNAMLDSILGDKVEDILRMSQGQPRLTARERMLRAGIIE